MTLSIALATFTIALQPSRPNIILFVCDDLGYREVGAYGLKNAKTPHLDQLAKDGTRFTGFYSGSPVCAPSRATLMTGKHTGHVAIRGNKEVGGWNFNDPEGQMPLPANEFTLAEALQKGGYETGAFGKWGLGGPMSEGHPLNQGFDRFFGYLCQRQAHNHFPAYLWNDRFLYTLEGNQAKGLFSSRFDSAKFPKAGEKIPDGFFDQFKGQQYGPDVIEDQAIAWMKKKRTKPFFMYFPIALPHTALQAPDKLVNEFPHEWDRLPYISGSGYLPNRRPRATYAAMLKKIDDSMGRIRQNLVEMGVEKNTIIIFTSDNGTAFLKQVDSEFFGSVSGLNGFKGSCYEGGLRVPMIVQGPGTSPSKVSDHVWYMPDLMPTVLKMAHLPVPRNLDGRSLGEPRPVLYWEYPEGNHSQAVLLDGRWKAVRSNLKASIDIELFDLKVDEAESVNIASENPEILKRAVEELRKQHVPSKDFKLNRIDQSRF